MSVRSLATSLAHGLADLILPNACPACSIPLLHGQGALCVDCELAFGKSVSIQYCITCGDDAHPHLMVHRQCSRCRMKAAGPRFDRFIRVGRYESPLRELILMFKKKDALDHFWGRRMAAAIMGQIDPRSVDFWTPVPAHWRRRLWVGFQPTRALVRAVVRELGGRMEESLAAVKYVRPLHLDANRSPTRSAVRVKNSFAVVDPGKVRGKTIGLVDDVMTHGATLMEARRVLKNAGAARILAVVLAKTVRGSVPLNPHGLDQPTVQA